MKPLDLGFPLRIFLLSIRTSSGDERFERSEPVKA
jgi:hypothetical protein